MNPGKPPAFDEIASEQDKRAFVGGGPSVVMWLDPGTKLYKWTKSIMNAHGVTPWWLFLESRVLSSGLRVDGLRERQVRARRIGSADREFHRARAAVTKQFNPMTSPMVVALTQGAWAYVGRAAGQLVDKELSDLFFIGGDVQIWIPGLRAQDVVRLSALPYLAPST